MQSRITLALCLLMAGIAWMIHARKHAPVQVVKGEVK